MLHRRSALALFLATFVAFAWFHEGGGWNQNARFAMVRSLVEQGRSTVDDYLVYTRAPGTDGHLSRATVRDGRFALEGKAYAFAWRGADGRMVPLEGAGPPGAATQVDPAQVACSGDLAFHGGHFHPNKAPGTSWAAVPGYAVVRGVVRAAGLDSDDWWILTLSAWLASVLSVGLLAALGCVVLYRLAMGLGAAPIHAWLAAATLAFGTMYLSYATALYEHDLIAVALLAAFALLHGLRRPGPEEPPERQVRLRLALAGASAGFAAVCNYAMAVPVAILGAYLVLAVPRRGAWRWYALGVLVPFLALCAYQAAAFGSPFSTNYQHQNPMFLEETGALLGVFRLPQPGALAALLLSPFRGLFYGSPVLLLAAPGLLAWLRDPGRRAEAWLTLAMLAFFLLLVASFNGWHGGWAAGPRYLVPVLPFLCLPLAHAWARLPRLTGVLALVSVAIQLVTVAVDYQAPLGVGVSTTLPERPLWRHDPLLEYELPLFVEGRAGPFLRAQRAHVLSVYEEVLVSAGNPPAVRARELAQLAGEIDAAIATHAPAPLLVSRTGAEVALWPTFLSTFAGPVSVNPVGMSEGSVHQLFPAGSVEARWNAFNAGELLFPGSRWSLAPLLLWVGACALLAARGRKEDPGSASGDLAGGAGAAVPPAGK